MSALVRLPTTPQPSRLKKRPFFTLAIGALPTASWREPSAPRGGPLTRLSRAQLVLGLYGALALGGALIAAYRGDANVYTLPGVRTSPSRLLVSLAVGTAFGLGVVALSRLAIRRFGWARLLHSEFRALLGPLGRAEILALALGSAVGEEFFFRGALLPAAGLWASSGVFALLHIGPGRRYLPWTASALLVGLAMGGLALLLGDLGAPIAAHFTINFLNLRHIARHELS